MKRILYLLSLIVLCFIVLSPTKVNAALEGYCGKGVRWKFDDVTKTLTVYGNGRMDDGYYVLPNGTTVFRELPGPIEHVVIEPGVTYIGNSAFHSFKSLKTVYIADTVTEIGQSAFAQCWELTAVWIPSSVKKIGNSAFTNCGLKELVVPSSQVEEYAFKGSSLETIWFTAPTLELSEKALSGCNKLKNVVIKGSIKEIPDGCFSYSEGLESIVIPDGVERIGERAFERCTSLKCVKFPDSVTEMGEQVFYNCIALESIVLPDQLQKIPGGAFMSCTALKRVFYPKALTTIGGYAFDGCTALTTVVLPEGVTNMGICAYRECKNLQYILFPETLQSVGNDAFRNCDALTTVVLPDSVTEIGSKAFLGCSNLTQVHLPDSLKVVSESIFKQCGKLKNIIVPASVTTVEPYAFASGDDLEYVLFMGSRPTIDSGAFHNEGKYGIHYIAGAEGWDGFEVGVAYGRKHASVFRGTIEPITLPEVKEPEVEVMSAPVLPDIPQHLVWSACSNGHTAMTVAAVEPNCINTGLTEGKVCKSCGVVLQAQEVVPATGVHTFSEWKIIDNNAEGGVLVERSCVHCEEKEQKLLEPQDLGPSNPPTAPTDVPTDPTNTTTEPTQVPTDVPVDPTQGMTEPTQAPADPTQPDITVKEEPKGFPWAIVVIAVAAIGAAVGGVILGKKRK